MTLPSFAGVMSEEAQQRLMTFTRAHFKEVILHGFSGVYFRICNLTLFLLSGRHQWRPSGEPELPTLINSNQEHSSLASQWGYGRNLNFYTWQLWWYLHISPAGVVSEEIINDLKDKKKRENLPNQNNRKEIDCKIKIMKTQGPVSLQQDSCHWTPMMRGQRLR